MTSPWSVRRERTGRLVGIDLARCLALVGMICTHLVNPRDDLGQITVLQQVAGGRASALFAVLAGVSVSLVTGRTVPPAGVRLLGARCGLLVRAALVATLGLWLGGLDSGIAVILAYYGALFVLGLPFLGLRAPVLAALAAAWCVVAPVTSHLLRPHLPQLTSGIPSAEGLVELVPLALDLTFTGYYPAVPWLTYLLAGMAVGRLDLSRPVVAIRLTLVGAALAAAAWLVSHVALASPDVQSALQLTGRDGRPLSWPATEQQLIDGLFGTTPTDSWWWLVVAAPHTATPFDLAQTTGSALAVLGGCLLLTRWRPRVWSVVGGAGAMTLTLYALHVLVATGVWPREVDYAPVRHIVLVLVVGAVFGLASLKGPLELVVAGVSRDVANLCTSLARPAPRVRQ